MTHDQRWRDRWLAVASRFGLLLRRPPPRGRRVARRSGRIGPCRVADDLFPDAPKVPLPRRPSQAHPPLPSSVVGMTDGELCRAWRRSFATVARTGSTATKHAAVVQRATYLDEIERRDPRAFRLWLASGAWATGSPHCYLDEEPPCGRTDAA